MFDKRDRAANRFFAGLLKNRYNSATAARGLDGEFLLGMTLAIVAVFVLWWTPLLFPFRIYTTAVHEVSHFLASIAVSGTWGDIRLNWNGSGSAQVAFSGTVSAIIVYSAGYLGSVLFGGLLLLRSKRASTRRQTMMFITFILLIITVLAIRDVTSLLLVGIVGGLSGLTAWKAPDILVTFSIYVLALLSSLYALMDLFFLFMSSTNPFHRGVNDAQLLANITGIPALVWATVWGAVGLFIMFMFVRRAIRRAAPADGPGTTSPYTPSRNGSSEASAFDRYDDYLSKR